MSLPRYESYKDSGVEWLGEVPEHWGIVRLRYLCKIETGDADTVDSNEDGSYPFFVRSPNIEKINRYTHDCEAILTAGDGVGVGKVFHYFDGKFCAHQRVYIFRQFEGVQGKFFFHYLKELFLRVVLEGTAKSTVDSLRRPMIADFLMTVPYIEEQSIIADFLDQETAKIDNLIAEQQQLIKLLKEKRQAVISHAVTKGLNPDVPMKDSGVEWLGEVPEHWRKVAIKRMTLVITDGAHISPETDGGIYDFVSTKDISDAGIDFDGCLKTSLKSYEYLVRTGCKPMVGDILFSKDGTIGRTFLVDKNSDFVVASSLIIIRPNSKILDSVYFNWLCQSYIVTSQVQSFVKGAGLPRLSIKNLMKIIAVFPPLEEQLYITSFFSSAITKFDVLNKEAQIIIELLKERRSALISSAVTGKIDVQNFVSTQSQVEAIA